MTRRAPAVAAAYEEATGFARPRRRRGAWLAAAALASLLAGCSEGSGEDGEVASAEAPERTPATEPPATDPEAVRPYVEDLLERYDGVLNQIVADPSVAGDRDDPLVEEYLGLFEPDSEFTEDVLAAWVDDGETGRSVRPYDDDHPPYVSHLSGDVEMVGENEVVFSTCIERRLVVYEDDVLRQETPYFADPGSGAAVRVDGMWRLRQLSIADGGAGCGGGVL